MATLEQLSAALVKADAAGNVEDAKALANAIRQMRGVPNTEGMPGARKGVDQFGIPVEGAINPTPPEAPLSFREKLSGIVETPVALASNLVSGPITYLAGAGGPEFQKKVAGEIQYQPRTRLAQRALESVGQGLEASKIPPFMPMIGGPANALSAAAPFAENALTTARATPLVQAIEGPLAARAARTQETNVAKSYQNAPRIDAAKDALDLGIALNPATTNPTTGNKLRVAVVGSDTLDTKLAQHNLPQYTNIAKEDLGLPSTVRLDAKAFEQSRARPEVSGPYEAVRKLSAIAPDASTMDALENMKVTPLIGDEGQAANVNGFIDKVKQQLEQGVDGKTLVDSIRQRRRDAQAVYKQQSAGVNPPSPEAIARADVNLGIANTLEGLIESNISSDPKLLAAFRDARTAMAKTYDYERATNFATGQIDPQVIARMAAEGKPMSGKLAQIGNVAANFPEVSKGGVANEPTWRETLPRSGAAGTAGALLGSPLGLPGSIAGGALGAAAGNVASGALARNMVKPGFQKANVVPPDYRPNALTPANRNALSK